MALETPGPNQPSDASATLVAESSRPTSSGTPFIRVQRVSKSFLQGDMATQVLMDVDLEIQRGEYLALMGPSGSGKTTLLNMLSGLDRPSSGSIKVGGLPLSDLDEKGLARWRRVNVGFIFQQYHLLSVMSAFENVEIPLLLFDMDRTERRARVLAALEIVGLLDRASYTPDRLSGGQQQRVGIARAIVHDPQILIADEPTGNLDAGSSGDVLDLFDVLNGSLGKTIVMVTHDPKAAERAHGIRHLEKGRLLEPGTQVEYGR